jgi:probable HAF family extracellular repeat protein
MNPLPASPRLWVPQVRHIADPSAPSCLGLPPGLLSLETSSAISRAPARHHLFAAWRCMARWSGTFADRHQHSSYAYGVNDSGEVVGYSWLADGDQQAFLYTGGTMLDLNSLIPTNSGWELLTAYGINDSGQITGEGLYNGQLSAFLLMNPTRFIFHAPIIR